MPVGPAGRQDGSAPVLEASYRSDIFGTYGDARLDEPKLPQPYKGKVGPAVARVPG